MKKEPKTVNGMSMEAVQKRINQMLELRDQWIRDIDNAHVILQQGNSKTGKNCWTTSLIPIVDCKNCSGCKDKCYDICHVCYLPSVQNDRARNSAIHLVDIARYWNEVSMQVKANFVQELRINVGGDITYEDLDYLNKIGKENPRTDILFFTKSYDDVNRWRDEGNDHESNVKCIFSAWPGMEMNNPYNYPVSHVLWKDGSTTAPEYGAVYCGGNCSECHFNEEGCWTLKPGESVIFPAH